MTGLPEERNWDDFWESKADSRFTKKSWSKTRMMALLDSVVEPGMDVLDAGSGSGFFSNYFIHKGCNVYSLDYSQDALELTKRMTGNRSQEYLREDLLDGGFGDRYRNRFDIIFSDGLFEHFPPEEQQKIMSVFIESKKDEGLITTFVPNKYSWWEVVRPLFMPGIKEKPFTMGKLLELHGQLLCLKKGGLNVIPASLSPDGLLGQKLGMILFVFAR